MANIAPNITSVGISCEAPPAPPPGDGAIAHAASGKNRFIGTSGYPILREKPSPEGAECTRRYRLAHRCHQRDVEAHVVQGEQPVRQQFFGDEEVAEIRAGEGATRVAVARGVERRTLASAMRPVKRRRPRRSDSRT